MKDTADSIVDYVLNEQRLVVQFHPVCSAKQRKVVGFEALSRGIDDKGIWIPPARLFGEAAREGKTLELDRACRDVAMRSFKDVLAIDSSLVLFVNMEASIVDRGIVGSGYLLRSATDAGIPPEQIVVEIVESRARNTAALNEFAVQQRQHGFLLALDDVGTGHSNLERLALIKPDIIKTDRSLTHHVDREYHKQEILGSFISMAHKVGAVVVAEGIETREAGLTVLDRGADLVQGYYFGLPQDATADALDTTQRAVAELADAFRGHMVDKVRQLTDYNRTCEETVVALMRALQSNEVGEYDACLIEAVTTYPELECAYILDFEGEQLTDTVFCEPPNARRGSYIFRPAARGADHSAKDYVFALQTGLRRFVTPPYISLASGHLCQTRSLAFDGPDGEAYILCADFVVKTDHPDRGDGQE